jgi:hypothetical protein
VGSPIRLFILAIHLHFIISKDSKLTVVNLMKTAVQNLIFLALAISFASAEVWAAGSVTASPSQSLGFVSSSPIARPAIARKAKPTVTTAGDDLGFAGMLRVGSGPVFTPPPVSQPVVVPPPSLPMPPSRPVSYNPPPTPPPISNFAPPTRAVQLPPERPNDQLEAAFTGSGKCPYPDGRCNKGMHNAGLQAFPKNVAGLEGEGKFHSAAEACYSNQLLETARHIVRNRYGNQSASAGRCAVGVRTSIAAAGIYGGGSQGPGAINYQGGVMKAFGFENFIKEYPTPQSAPPGAVLIFAGPQSDRYLTRGYNDGTGNTLGHITIKGDSKHGDDWYYTDGRTKQPAVGWPKSTTRRRLVGVWLMQKCTSTCSKQLREKCGAFE